MRLPPRERETDARATVARCGATMGVLAGVVVLAVSAPVAAAARRSCDPHAAVHLDVAAAAGAKAVGRAAATSLARRLTAGRSICDAPASGWVTSRLARVPVGDRARADRQLRALLAAIRSHPYRQTASAYRSRAATPCDLDRTRHVHLSDARQVADYLSVAAKAQLVGDEAASAAAIRGADQAFTRWAQVALAKSTSVPDFVTIATGAQMLSLERISRTALARARRLAIRHYQEIRAQMDPCYPNRHDLDCQKRAYGLMLLLGVQDAKIEGALVELANAVPRGRPVSPCEEMVFRMTIAPPASPTGPTPVDASASCTLIHYDSSTGNGLECDDYLIRDTGGDAVWNGARFRVDPTKDRFIPIDKGGGGVLHQETYQCIAANPDDYDGTKPWLDYGQVTISGAQFGYALDGEISGGQLDVSVSTSDLNVTVTGPTDCDSAAGGVGQVGALSFDATFSLAAGQSHAASSQDVDGSTLKATIDRVD